MLTRAMWIAVCGLTLVGTSFAAEPPKTYSAGKNDIRPLYLNSNTGPERTLLTSENRFPQVGKIEVGPYFQHDEQANNDRDSIGIFGRYGLWENMAVDASVPYVDSEFFGEDNNGLGDIDLNLDLLAFQDIFRYPFIIPHAGVTLPTGDEDEGLGTGETVFTFGVSVGTKVYDCLTYVVDASYAFNGRIENGDADNVFYASASVVWDISDRFALITEGRIYEENSFDDNPYEIQGGFAYRFTEDVQFAVYGGQYSEETGAEDDEYDIAAARLTLQF